MNDLIVRKEALKAIKNGLADWTEFGKYNKDLYGEIENGINDLPSVKPEPKWIPVSEALPINGIDVIVSVLDDSGDTPYRFTSVGWCISNGQYWVVDNEMRYGVIAWMPLPDPWRGE